MAKAEKVIADYNKGVEEDEKKMDKVKKAVKSTSEMIINMLEEKMYRKQEKMNEKMQDTIAEINNRFEQLEGKEGELKNFSAGLAMLMGEISGDDITGSG